MPNHEMNIDWDRDDRSIFTNLRAMTQRPQSIMGYDPGSGHSVTVSTIVPFTTEPIEPVIIRPQTVSNPVWAVEPIPVDPNRIDFKKITDRLIYENAAKLGIPEGVWATTDKGPTTQSIWNALAIADRHKADQQTIRHLQLEIEKRDSRFIRLQEQVKAVDAENRELQARMGTLSTLIAKLAKKFLNAGTLAMLQRPEVGIRSLGLGLCQLLSAVVGATGCNKPEEEPGEYHKPRRDIEL